MTFRTLIASLALLLLIGCAKNDREKTLAHIADLVSESPEVALAALDSITRTDLSNRDKHFYDFLTIKARDKAYIRHSSDSLILDLISFYHDSARINSYIRSYDCFCLYYELACPHNNKRYRLSPLIDKYPKRMHMPSSFVMDASSQVALGLVERQSQCLVEPTLLQLGTFECVPCRIRIELVPNEKLA